MPARASRWQPPQSRRLPICAMRADVFRHDRPPVACCRDLDGCGASRLARSSLWRRRPSRRLRRARGLRRTTTRRHDDDDVMSLFDDCARGGAASRVQSEGRDDREQCFLFPTARDLFRPHSCSSGREAGAPQGESRDIRVQWPAPVKHPNGRSPDQVITSLSSCRVSSGRRPSAGATVNTMARDRGCPPVSLRTWRLTLDRRAACGALDHDFRRRGLPVSTVATTSRVPSAAAAASGQFRPIPRCASSSAMPGRS